jgi:hypothetical protein
VAICEFEPGYPPSPPRSIGIIGLAENLNLIQVAQSFAGKIFETKDLMPAASELRRFASRWSDKEAVEGKVRDHIAITTDLIRCWPKLVAVQGDKPSIDIWYLLLWTQIHFSPSERR